MLEPHQAAQNTSAFSFQYVINDAISAFLGFTLGNLIACDYIYKRRIYIVERLHFEKQSNFNRYTFDSRLEDGKLPDEYPFAEYVTLKDKEIVEDRIHPREVVEQNKQMRERMDQIEEEYRRKNAQTPQATQPK